MEAKTRVVVVEDEPCIAQDLSMSLKGLGYEVPALASCAQDAYDAASVTRPDMILMDIDLEGKTDGIEAATKIYSDLGIPVVFLTAHADTETLRRALGADPFGYMSKPVVRGDLANTIETALQRHRKQNALQVREAWLEAQLKSVGQGLIAINFDGIIWFINPHGEQLMGVKASDVVGRSFISAVPLRHSKTGKRPEDFVRLTFLHGRTINIGEDYVVDRPGNRKLAGEVAISRFNGEPIGVVFTFRDDTVEPYRRDSLPYQVVRSGDLDCSRREVTLYEILNTLEPKLHAKLPTGTALKISLGEQLYSISGNWNILEVLLAGLAGIAGIRVGKRGSVHLSAFNLDFERCQSDGSISRYVRLRVTCERGEVAQDASLVFSTDGNRLCLDLSMAKIQSALQALQATAHEGSFPGHMFWDIDLPARVGEPIVPGEDQHPSMIVVIESDASVRRALCERYLPSKGIECLGAKDAAGVLDWARMFEADQIAVLILPERSYTSEIDAFLEISPSTSILLIAERNTETNNRLQRCSAPSAIVDRLYSQELLKEELNRILRARANGSIQADSETRNTHIGAEREHS